MSKILDNQILTNTASQKVLYFLACNSDKELYDAEIHKMLPKLSKASVNNVLKSLNMSGYTDRIKRGKIYLNKIKDLPEILNFKIMSNITFVKKIISLVRTNTIKIVLFGSFAFGDNHSKSDIDLFIISNKPDLVRRKLESYDNLQLIIKKPEEMLEWRKENEVFYAEVNKGIVLWEQANEEIL